MSQFVSSLSKLLSSLHLFIVCLIGRCLLLESDIKLLREKNNIEVKSVGQSYQIVAGDKVKLEQVHP
jgi:hypothetical protein